jgi:putative transposon-encoded protein
MKIHFDNIVEKDSTPKQYIGKLVFEIAKNIEVVFGKGTVKGQKRANSNSNRHTFLTGRTFKLVASLI